MAIKHRHAAAPPVHFDSPPVRPLQAPVLIADSDNPAALHKDQMGSWGGCCCCCLLYIVGLFKKRKGKKVIPAVLSRDPECTLRCISIVPDQGPATPTPRWLLCSCFFSPAASHLSCAVSCRVLALATTASFLKSKVCFCVPDIVGKTRENTKHQAVI